MKTIASLPKTGSFATLAGHLGSPAAIAVLAILALGLSAAAQEEFVYTNNGDGITITKYTGAGGDVDIPEKIDGKRVTSIGPYAFFNCTTLTGITNPETITGIGSSAFEGCGNLAHLTLPDSLTTLGARAFSGCTSLTAVTIPGSITHWPEVASNTYPDPTSGSWAFADCTNLTTVTIGDGLKTIPPYGFFGCIKLASVLLPASVVGVGNGAFVSCRSLTAVRIPDSVTSLGAYAFSGCASLTSVILPGTITQWPVVTNVSPYPFPPVVGSWVFQDCTNLTILTVGDGVQSIPPYAFSACLGLNTVLLPNSVVRIANGAFEACRSLTGLTIPNSVTRLGARAFAGCTSLTSITVPGSVADWDVIGVDSFWVGPPVNMLVPGFTAAWTFGGCTNLKTVMVDDGVRTLPPDAFGGCSQLTSVTIPRSVTSLGMLVDAPASAWPIFSGCTNLTGIYFEGDSPTLLSDLIDGTPGNTTVYYPPGTAGWGATYGGCPTALWAPQMQTLDSSFGAGTNGFGFTLSWARGKAVTVEACTDLLNPAWTPVRTLTLTNGYCYFSDTEWRNYPGRFYRLRSP